jgi:hypothetical protein
MFTNINKYMRARTHTQEFLASKGCYVPENPNVGKMKALWENED